MAVRFLEPALQLPITKSLTIIQEREQSLKYPPGREASHRRDFAQLGDHLLPYPIAGEQCVQEQPLVGRYSQRWRGCARLLLAAAAKLLPNQPWFYSQVGGDIVGHGKTLQPVGYSGNRGRYELETFQPPFHCLHIELGARPVGQ